MLLLIAPLAGLATNVLLQALLARIVPRGAHLRSQFLSFALGLLVTLLLLLYLLARYPFSEADRIGYLVMHSIAYACLGFCFFNVINANVSSLRVRMLKEYLLHDPECLADAVMYKRYPAAEILAARLARLEAGKQIRMRDGRYYLCGRGVVLIGRFFAAMQRLLLRSARVHSLANGLTRPMQ